ncbi:SDR family oxidoreductase [Sphaerisporangium sp. TRM90804]|uniref:SDR family oxidoreductase n=1 Tax=Sphaerisporangium sp. TRM90804 TaxID=3031113 RepID=UPI0024497AEC|nr:SDR family oxidoreductase [Sphaerisporangium sp. TRM90804]MDH2429203.1 SDR family oxidoreductase [Sphaerisporangium sp. TRM90804]
MILVTGATGAVGNHVVAQLVEAGAKVRALTRSPGKARFDPQVDVAIADVDKPETLPPALEGVERVFMLAPSHHAPAHDANIVKAAQAAGVRHLVKISGLGTIDDAPDAITRWHLEGERAVKESGIAWTILQPGEFMSNTFYWTYGIKGEGVVREPHGDTRQALVDPRDIGSVAAVVLTTEGHEGKSYPLTGPEALTPKERVAKISAALGRPIEFAQLTPQQARDNWVMLGAPEELIDAVQSVLADDSGRWARVYPTVEQLTGRPARSFDQWLADHLEAFR